MPLDSEPSSTSWQAEEVTVEGKSHDFPAAVIPPNADQESLYSTRRVLRRVALVGVVRPVRTPTRRAPPDRRPSARGAPARRFAKGVDLHP